MSGQDWKQGIFATTEAHLSNRNPGMLNIIFITCSTLFFNYIQ